MYAEIYTKYNNRTASKFRRPAARGAKTTSRAPVATSASAEKGFPVRHTLRSEERTHGLREIGEA